MEPKCVLIIRSYCVNLTGNLINFCKSIFDSLCIVIISPYKIVIFLSKNPFKGVGMFPIVFISIEQGFLYLS